MNVARHIFAKDMRRLRWPLVAWLAIVAGRIVVVAATSELAFADEAMQIAMGSISTVLAVMDTLMLVLLVSWLVHDEPLVGADAFWLTRPIQPTTLMTAKLIFAALFLVVAAATSQAATTAVITRSATDAIRVMPTSLFSQSLWVAGLLAIATLTPSVMRFLLTLVGVMATVVVAMSAMTAVLLMTLEIDDGSPPAIPDRTTPIVTGWLLLGVALTVIASQYRTRRLRRAVLLGIAGLILSVLVADVWPWRFARADEPELGAWAQDPQRVALALDEDPPYVMDAFYRRGTAPKKAVAAPLHLIGVPPEYDADTISVRGRLEFADGRALQIATGGMVSVRRAGMRRPSGHMAAMQAALGSTKLLRPQDDDQYDLWPSVLTVTDEEYENYGHTPGRLSATVTVSLRRWRVIGTLPLVEGAMLRAPSLRFEVRRLIKRPDDAPCFSGKRPSEPRQNRAERSCIRSCCAMHSAVRLCSASRNR